MYRSRGLRATLLVLSLSLVAAACGNRSDGGSTTSSNNGGGGGSTSGSTLVDTSNCPATDGAGVSGDTITLASSFPQSGLTAPFSEISKGYKAYFDSVNAAGGVKIGSKSYKIKVVDKDDEYNASKTVQNINDLVGTDGSKAFAVFNVVGTANNIAIRSSLGQNCVPNVFAATGSPAWGNPAFPWTVGSTLAPYSLEGKAFAGILEKKAPKAKVAMLVQDDDFGKAYEEGFKKAIAGTGITIAKVEKYAAGANEVASQITSLKATGADAFFNGATLLACPNALQEAVKDNWKPITWVSGTCISKTLMGIAGAAADKVYSATNIKDPMNPAFAKDPAMLTYRKTLKDFGASDIDPENGIVAYGYTQGVILVKVLESLTKPSRSQLIEAMHSLDLKGLGLVIDGVNIKTSKDDPYVAENVQPIQYDAKATHFNNVGPVIDFEGKTASFTPTNLING